MPRAILQAGALRHRVEIVDPTLAQDTFGGTRLSQFTPFAVVWASVESLTGRELEAAQQVVAQVTHRITMRWMRGIRAAQNVTFDGRFFQIMDVQNPDERRHVLILLCMERERAATD